MRNSSLLNPWQPRSHTFERRCHERNIRGDTSEAKVGVLRSNSIPVVERAENYEAVHRLLDILGSLIGLTLFSPFMIAAIPLIKIGSKGPVFFKQVRIGKAGKPFVMYKLRTMVVNAQQLQASLEGLNEQKGSAFKMKNDPRVTAVGKWLRKFSLDEVPQFLNVLKGDMSLVGPRPPLRKEVKTYRHWQLQRLAVKPGMTGIWQISGRNRVAFDDWVRLDISYIRRRSLRFDIKIMLGTFRVLFVSPDGK